MSGQFLGGDETNAIVLDVGTYQVKAGYGGEDTPKFVFPSVVGSGGVVSKEDKMDVDGASPYHVGTHAMSFRRDGMDVVSPFQDGLFSDWDVVESLWSHALKDQMRLSAQEHPIMLAEPSHNTKEVREKTTELMFEKYGAPALFLARNAVLSSFASGRQTSLIVDSGHEATTVAAVADGYLITKSLIRTPLAGHLLNKCLLQSIEASGVKVLPRYSFKRVEKSPGQFKVENLKFPKTTESYRNYQIEAIIQDAKHTICRVSDTPFDPSENESIPTVSYELPDGQEIQVGTDRFTVPEVLFNPTLLTAFKGVPAYLKTMGVSQHDPDAMLGLHQVVDSCIGSCDVDVRRELYSGVVLTGGTALFSTLRDRLERELTEKAPNMAKVKVVAPINAVERRYSAWIGGSILSSLGSFQQMWMSKQEYQEHGAGLIHKKAP